MLRRCFRVLSSCPLLPSPKLVARNPRTASYVSGSVSDFSLKKYHQQKAESNCVPYDQAISLMKDEGIILIDVRHRYEVEGKYIPGSINIPLNEVVQALNQFTEDEFKMKYGIARPLPDAPIIFICTYGIRSSLAQKSAMEIGFTNSKFSKMN